MKKLIAVTAVVLAGICTNAAALVWIEGESALKTNLSANPWMKGDNPKLLSGGDAFACLNDNSNPLPKPGFVLWKIDVPEAGDYQVYFRHGYLSHLGKIRYRFVQLGADGAPVKKPGAEEGWNKFDADAKVMDQQPIGQYRTIEWTKQAPVKLDKGSYYLDLQVTEPGADHVKDSVVWTLIDCICLTKEAFAPNGATKPGEAPAAAGGTDKAKDADYY